MASRKKSDAEHVFDSLRAAIRRTCRYYHVTGTWAEYTAKEKRLYRVFAAEIRKRWRQKTKPRAKS